MKNLVSTVIFLLAMAAAHFITPKFMERLPKFGGLGNFLVYMAILVGLGSMIWLVYRLIVIVKQKLF